MKDSFEKNQKKALAILEKMQGHCHPELVKEFEEVLAGFHVSRDELENQLKELRSVNRNLEEQYQRQDMLFVQAPTACFILDEHHRIISFNNMAAQTLDLSAEKIYNRRFEHFVDSGSLEAFNRHCRESLLKGSPGLSEIQMVIQGQLPGSFLLNILSFQDPHDRKIYTQISLTPVSSARESELLRDSERRYRLLFRNMINGMLVLKPRMQNGIPVDFLFFRANDALEKMTGFNTATMEGASFMKVFPDQGSEILQMIFRSEQNTTQKKEALELKPGLIVNIYSFVPEPGYIALIFEDVTARVKAESEHLKSEEMLKTIFTILPVGVTITDVNGDIIDCNEASEALLGIKKEEHLIRNLAGKEWKIIRTDFSQMPIEEYASVRALHENCIVENVEMGIVKGPEHTTWINVSAAPIPLPDLGVAIVYTDITERVQAQEESEEKFKSIVQNSTDAIIIVNHAGSVVEWNRGCELIFGISRKAALSQKLWTLIGKVIRPGFAVSDKSIFVRERIQEALTTGESPWFNNTSETEIADGTGRIKTIQSAVFSVKSAQGYMLGIVSRDITVAKETERMLKIARDTAEDASQAKSRFLANISHEIRTPLNVILGYTEILKAVSLSEEKSRAHLSAIEKSSKALMSLINDILDLSRIEAGKISLNPVAVNLRSLVEDVRQIFSLKAGSKGLSITLEVSPCLSHLVRLDETRVRQVLFNLVSNAVKFTARGGVLIKVEARNASQKSGKTNLTLIVEDTGIGIEPTERDTIFDPFYQKEVPVFIKQEGTGLGLAISKRFVEMMGGEITVKSAPGSGTTFSVFIPEVPVVEHRNRAGKARLPEHAVPADEKPAALTDNAILADRIFSEIFDGKRTDEQVRAFLQSEIWTEFDKIADILGFEEVILFAESLARTAHKHNLNALLAFAEKLRKQATAFNVIEINLMLFSLEKHREKTR